MKPSRWLLLLLAPLVPLLGILFAHRAPQEWQPEPIWQGAPVTALHFSPNGRLFAVGDDNGWVRVWPMNATSQTGPPDPKGLIPSQERATRTGSHAPILTVQVGTSTVRWFKFSPDNRHFLCQTKVPGSLADSQTSYWNTRPLKCLGTWDNGETVGAAAVISPDGALLAMSVNGLLKIWDLRAGRWLRTITPQPVGDGSIARVCVTSLSFTPDGKRLAGLVFGHNASVSAYNLQGWSVTSGHQLWHKDEVELDYPAACGLGGMMNYDGAHWELLDSGTGMPRKVFIRESPGNPHVGIALSPRLTNSVAYDFNSHRITVRDLATETVRSTLYGPRDFKVMGVSPDSRTIAIGDSSNAVTLWHRVQ